MCAHSAECLLDFQIYFGSSLAVCEYSEVLHRREAKAGRSDEGLHILIVNRYQIGFDSRHVYYLVPGVAHTDVLIFS